MTSQNLSSWKQASVFFMAPTQKACASAPLGALATAAEGFASGGGAWRLQPKASSTPNASKVETCGRTPAPERRRGDGGAAFACRIMALTRYSTPLRGCQPGSRLVENSAASGS